MVKLKRINEDFSVNPPDEVDDSRDFNLYVEYKYSIQNKKIKAEGKCSVETAFNYPYDRLYNQNIEKSRNMEIDLVDWYNFEEQIEFIRKHIDYYKDVLGSQKYVDLLMNSDIDDLANYIYIGYFKKNNNRVLDTEDLGESIIAMYEMLGHLNSSDIYSIEDKEVEDLVDPKIIKELLTDWVIDTDDNLATPINLEVGDLEDLIGFLIDGYNNRNNTYSFSLEDELNEHQIIEEGRYGDLYWTKW